jgi:Hypothetical glycosyl hydrolase family 15
MRLRTALVLLGTTLVVPAGAGASAPVGHMRYAIDSNATFPSYEQSATRQGVVILHAWQQDRLRALKAANPAITVLVYKNLSFAIKSTGPNGFASTGVTYAEADRDQPEWFLLNTSGERFTSRNYNYQWAVDVGSPSYQQRWADNVISELQSQGWDGVLMDDANPTMKYHYDVASVAKYPSDAAYSAATRSALAAIGPRVRAAGKLAMANIGSWAEYPKQGNDWLQFLDGGMEEMFLKWGNSTGAGYGGIGRWNQDLELLKESERQGKMFLAITHSDLTDARAARYGYATMLLGSNGRGRFSLAHDYTNETWFPEYDYDLGNATAVESTDANGVHRRPFERGLVLVNPTGSSLAVSFGGSYSGSGLASASSTTMPAQTGLVLVRDGGTTDPGTPTDPSRPRGRPKPKSKSISLLATVRGARRVELRWTGGGPGIKRFRVRRNGKLVAVVRRKRLRDMKVRPGRRYRYRVTGVRRNGKRVRASRIVRVRTPHRAHRASHGSAAGSTLVAGFAARDPRNWTEAFVEQRARVGGRLAWRRVTRVTRPRASMRFRVLARRGARVRLVVRSASGDALRCAPLRARSR